MASLKDQIRAAEDLKFRDDVEIPEWAPGVKFLVKGLPSADWEAYHNSSSKMTVTGKKTGSAEMVLKSNKAVIVAKALYDPETGERVYTDLAEGVAVLSQKSAGIVASLFTLVEYLSGGDKDFTEKVSDAEEDFTNSQD